MPRLQTYAPDGRLVSEVDLRSLAEARADKLRALALTLTARIAAILDPGEDDLVLVIARVIALSAADRQALAELRAAAAAHRAAIRGLHSVAALDAYDLEQGWPA